MNYRVISFSSLIGLALSMFAAERSIPANYYNRLNGLSGAALKKAVCEVIYPHNKLGYNSLWQYYPETDVKPGTNQVWDIYSDQTWYFPGNGGSVSGMNKEHSFPKSWWGGTKNNAYSDIFHLYPVLDKANSARSNYPYGEVDTSKGTKYNNGVSMTGTPVSGQGGGSSVVFEPDDRYKGDLARTYFYMVTCYQDLTWANEGTKTVSSNTYPTFNAWAQELFMRWHRNDPVSQKEIDRNEAIYNIQSNRNPFIDFPQLAEYLWGNKVGEKFIVEDHLKGTPDTPDTPDTPEEVPTLLSPSKDFVLHFGEVALGHTGSAQLLVRGEYLDESTSLRLLIYDDSSTDDASLFTIDGGYIANISSTVANSPDGIIVNVDYKPQSLGVHESYLVVRGGGLKSAVSISLQGECLPLPNPSAPEALPATDITTDSYTANWLPAEGEEVDHYIVNRTQYIDGHAETIQIETEDTFLEMEGFCGSESYTVQAVRLDVVSPESNAIVVGDQFDGIGSVSCESRFGATDIDGGILISCTSSLSILRVIDMSGREVARFTNVANNDVIYVPAGIYLLSTPSAPAPIKLVVK